jgi:Flp pilus assembly secretin CpaC
VDQETVVSCTAAGFSGQITATVANPVIASVDLAPGTLTLFYVEGHEAGSTTATFLTQPGGTGQLPIVVTANSP